VVLFSRVYSPELLAEYPVTSGKEPIKPLKIKPHAIKPIDVVLRRTTVTGCHQFISYGYDAFLKVISISSSVSGLISGD